MTQLNSTFLLQSLYEAHLGHRHLQLMGWPAECCSSPCRVCCASWCHQQVIETPSMPVLSGMLVLQSAAAVEAATCRTLFSCLNVRSQARHPSAAADATQPPWHAQHSHCSLLLLQATALVTDEPCSVHIPYCCLTECIRVPGGSEKWRYGVHMEHSFLSVPQEKTEADRQRELWYETQEV